MIPILLIFTEMERVHYIVVGYIYIVGPSGIKDVDQLQKYKNLCIPTKDNYMIELKIKNENFFNITEYTISRRNY